MPAPKIESVQVLRSQARTNFLLTAPSGWGKTPLLGTADERGRGGPKLLILSVDPEGAASSAFLDGTADMIQCHTWEELDAATPVVRSKVQDGTYQFVGIDSITEVQRLMMRWDVDRNWKANPAKRDQYVPAQDNYLRTQQMLVEYVKVMNAFPCSTIWTAHQQELEDSDGESRYLPMIHGGKGNVAQEVMGYMMVQGSGQLLRDEDEEKPSVRRMWFATDGPYRARDRTGTLGRYIDNPTMPQIMSKIQSAGGARRPVKKAMRTVRTLGKK